ncbi:hypothetical protein [Brevundimonas sp.]|uniref:hypothetical protein n=1 Tax=Brevundimonas sp. TaxID=1871086 RepID=UPI0028A00CED|nr:hypothetical protein [Brevundimonas sp.]
MTSRKSLTRTQVILLCQQQAQGPILCGCGCGEPLDPVTERVVDEHVIPRELSEVGRQGERDTIDNRRFYRWPCALEKTRADLARIAKAKAQGGETGQYARRQKRGASSIKSGSRWPPKGAVKLPSKKSSATRTTPTAGAR